MSKLIIFEGADGVGKTHHSKALSVWLSSKGLKNVPLSFPGNEIGTIGNFVYKLHHNSYSVGIDAIDPLSLQCLHIASHFDCINRIIIPTIEQGSIVILDRYWWSTYVYGIINHVNEKALVLLIEAEKELLHNLCDPYIMLLHSSEPHCEVEQLNKWKSIQKGYQNLAMNEMRHSKVNVIDTDNNADKTFAFIRQNVSQYLNLSE